MMFYCNLTYQSVCLCLLFYCSLATWYTSNNCFTVNKLSYRRESARRRLNYAVQDHSRSLMLVPIKPICDFLLVNNTNLHPILRRFQLPVAVKLSPLTRGCLSLIHSFSVKTANCNLNSMSYIAKTRLLELHICQTVWVYLGPQSNIWAMMVVCK